MLQSEAKREEQVEAARRRTVTELLRAGDRPGEHVRRALDRVEPLGGVRRRAQGAGFSTLILTVDTPVAGARIRDVHNGFTIPPALTVRTVANAPDAAVAR